MLRSSFSQLSDEVLLRELIYVLVCLDHVVPPPEGILVEDDVTRHMSSPPPPHRIIVLVRYSPGFIVDEDDLRPPRIELGEVGTRDIHVRDAAEHSEMIYHRLLVVPGLMWCLSVEASH